MNVSGKGSKRLVVRIISSTLRKVFPSKAGDDETVIETKLYDTKDIYVCKNKVAKPTVFIPVFPGSNGKGR